MQNELKSFQIFEKFKKLINYFDVKIFLKILKYFKIIFKKIAKKH